MNPKDILITDFDYSLPAEKIAVHPLEKRDDSKLLIYKNGIIEENIFAKIDDYLPLNSLLVFNNTKVIHARLRFAKPSGSIIEIFCLEPFGMFKGYDTVLKSVTAVEWKCLVGGAAKWKANSLQQKIKIGSEEIILTAKKIAQLEDAYHIKFSWNSPQHTFAEIIEAAGTVPLPPYIKRQTEAADEDRYQTIFASQHGSVAAPTAGLHFTDSIFKKFEEKNIQKTFVTLHVGAGTFKPVKAETMNNHEMHSEYLDVSYETIKTIQANMGKVCVVGTTSLRTVETLYWLGVRAIQNKNATTLSLLQWEVYDEVTFNTKVSASDALDGLLVWMRLHNKKNIFTKTQILIAPTYKFKIADMLITNFHQPKSTLLLLVAAAIGNDWKKMYDYAMKNDFRFLSYGDANLIFM